MENKQDDLKREIGAFGGFNILTGIMVGSGIFYLGSYVLERSNMSFGLSIVAWIIGGLITLISGLCYAELGAMMPVTGGSYVYLKKAYGKLISFMSGSTGYVLASCGSVAALSLAAAQIFPTFLNITEFQVKIIAIGLILTLSAINYLGVKAGSFVQNFFTVSKLIPIVLIIVIGLFFGKSSVDYSIDIGDSVDISSLIKTVAFAVLATLWAYEGWNNLNTVAGEMKKPQRNLPLAIISAILFVMGIYVLFHIAVYKTLGEQVIVDSLQDKEYYLGTIAAKSMLGSFGGVLVTSTMLIAIIGALNGCILVFPRQLYSMSKNDSFFKTFKKVHPKYNTPSHAIILTAVLSILLVMSNSLSQLTTLVIFSGLIFNTLIFISIFIFRRKYKEMERPYKVWFYPITPIVAVLVMIAMIVNTFIADQKTAIFGVVITISSLGIYFIYELLKRKGIE